MMQIFFTKDEVNCSLCIVLGETRIRFSGYVFQQIKGAPWVLLSQPWYRWPNTVRYVEQICQSIPINKVDIMQIQKRYFSYKQSQFSIASKVYNDVLQ